MNHRVRVLAAVGTTVVLFLAVQFGALALVEPFHDSERQAVENPEDPTNSIVYFAIILVATAFMLAAFRYEVQWLIRGLIVGVSVMLAWFVFTEVVPPVVTVGNVNAIAVGAALAVGLGLVVYPEWYVIDLAGVVMGAGAAGLFGISFGLLPAIVLLTVLAVYDAISVYKTKHMLSLAEGVMDLRIPVVLVVPTTLSYSYRSPESTDGVIEDGRGGERSETGGERSETVGEPRTAVGDESVEPDDAASPTTDSEPGDTTDSDGPTDADEPTDDGDGGEAAPDEFERDALFIGLGDAVIPTILVASAAYFLDTTALAVPGIVLNVPALGAIVGTIAGLLVLMHMVLQGRPHAGLPLLNGGAIGGYLLGALASGVSLATALGL